MSFILDALRKSESERRREAAPTLTRAPLAMVRRETPFWVWVAMGLLSVALVALGVAWWQRLEPALPLPGLAESGPGQLESGQAPLESGLAQGESPAIARASGAADAARAADEAAPATADAPPRSIRELYADYPALPVYSLEFIAFNASDPAASSAWIDGARYRPGEPIGGGPELVEVRADGVVLEHGGRRYLLGLR
jgi:hypothetical protein